MPEEQEPKTEETQTTEPETSTETKNTEPELTKEQLDIAFKHPRFKELTQAKKERDELLKKSKEQEEEEMKRKGELEQLLEQKNQELEQVQTRYSTQAKNNAILNEAAKRGVVDPDAVVRLIDQDSIEVDDNGNPSNVSDVVDNLLQEKTYLVGKKPDMGSQTSTSTNSDKPTYKQSELQQKIQSDVNWYMENKEDIDAAYAEGRVDTQA